MARAPMTPEKARQYWLKTSHLMWVVLAAWLALSIGAHLYAERLNAVTILGFPLGYYMAAQGSLIGFVLLIFWYARRQNRIDEDFHLSED